MDRKNMIMIAAAAAGAWFLLRRKSGDSAAGIDPAPFTTSGGSGANWGLPLSMMKGDNPQTDPNAMTTGGNPGYDSYSAPVNDARPQNPAPAYQPSFGPGDGSGNQRDYVIDETGYRTFADGSGGYIADTPEGRRKLMENWGIPNGGRFGSFAGPGDKPAKHTGSLAGY